MIDVTLPAIRIKELLPPDAKNGFERGNGGGVVDSGVDYLGVAGGYPGGYVG